MAKKNNDGDVAFVKALAELLRENDLTELEVLREYSSEDTLNVRVARQLTTAPVIQTIASAPSPAQATVPAQAAPASDVSPAEDPSQHPGAVTSPMVGTIYLAPEPGAPTFVSVGDTVAEGQTILIIEAMKTMNQVPAPSAGKIKRILVDDGSPVEFGTPLLIIE